MMKKNLIFLTSVLVLLFIFSSCSKEPGDYLSSGIKDFESGDYDSAIANLRRAKYLMPENFEANLYLGKCFLKNPKEKDAEYKARYYLNAAKELAKTSEERFNVSLTLLSIYEKRQDYSKIAKECKSLVEKDKKLLDKKKAYELYTLLADSYFKMEEYKEASETYEYIIKSFQEELANNQEANAKAHIQLAAAVVESDEARSGDGLSYATTAIRNEKDIFSNEYRLSAAKCFAILGDHFQKKQKYKISTVYYVRSKTYYVYLGDSKSVEDISEKIEKAAFELDKRCDDYECLMRKGGRELAEMDYDDAADYFKEAAQKGQTNSEKAGAISKLGIAYFLDGDEKNALSQFKALKKEYRKEYNKSVDKDRIDLFMGASLILTAKKPDTLTKKLLDKATGFFSADEKDGASAFKENIASGKKLIEAATNNITEKTPASYVREAAEVCERIGYRFEDWEMKAAAKKYYKRASEYYGKLFEKDKVVVLNKKIGKLN